MQKVALLILDGWGYSEETKGNAILAANTPNFDQLLKDFPYTLLHASGEYVGLPQGIMGNSEVGHENIGAGRVVKQKLTMISDLVKSGDFFANASLKKAFAHAKSNNSKLHFLGLISEGDVHAHLGHLDALIEMADKENIDKSKVFLHAISDGRDDPPYVAAELMERYQDKIDIATVSGRYWAMDRDKNWERNKKYFDCVVKKLNDPNGLKAKTAVDAIKHGYELAAAGKNPTGDSDEFILPTTINADGLIEENDSIVFFNFRPDRARQISMIFEYFASSDKEFKDKLAMNSLFEGFSETICSDHHDLELSNLLYTCFTEYSPALSSAIAFTEDTLPTQNLDAVLGQVIADNGLRQFRTAETEKFNHVTSFFNVRRKEPFVGEQRELIPSPKVPTYDLQPEMSLPAVADALIKAIKTEQYELLVCNFANPDMVGHTGKWDAIIKAIEAVDAALGDVLAAAKDQGYALLVTADHGNADQVLEADGSTRTAHSCNKVPLVVANSKAAALKQSQGLSLSNIAPTVLELLELEQPAAMTAESLLSA